METRQLSRNFLLIATILIIGMLSLLFQENVPEWLVYSLMAIGLIFLKPIFDGWMRLFWKLLLCLCGVVLLMEILLFFNL